MNEPRLGVDIGRVIIDGASHPHGGDTVFLHGGLADALRTPPMPGAFETLARLVRLFDGRVWLVSKCGERIQRRSLRWLDHQRFWHRTGIPRGNVRFCRRRPEKAGHCADLKITHFVDDRRDVLLHLRGLVGHRYLFGPQREPAPDWVVPTPAWPDVEREITTGIAGTAAGPR